MLDWIQQRDWNLSGLHARTPSNSLRRIFHKLFHRLSTHLCRLFCLFCCCTICSVMYLIHCILNLTDFHGIASRAHYYDQTGGFDHLV